MRKILCSFAILAIATTAQAGVIIEGTTDPEETLNGFDIYTLTAVSDMGGIVAFDFEGDPAADDLGFFGPMNNISNFGVPSVFSSGNGAIAATDDPRLDSQFLFNGLGDGTPSVTVPDGFANERPGFLGATFAAANSLGDSVPFARIVLPEGGSAEFTGIVVAGGMEIPVSGVVGIPEPATVGLIGLGLVGVLGLRRRS